MDHYGLIGKKLSHSFSPRYFKEKFEKLGISTAEYIAYELDNINEIEELLSKNIKGLNVTIPYKETVIPFLDRLDISALKVNAVNTIKKEGKQWVGYNTDTYGFGKSLDEFLDGRKMGNALILGTGGAAKAVKAVLEDRSIAYLEISRSKGDLKYHQLNKTVLSKHHLIVNTTPLGMYPKTNECPQLNYDGISAHHYLFDLIYNPQKTLFLAKGATQGAKIQNGLDMLIYQAERSWEIWNKT